MTVPEKGLTMKRHKGGEQKAEEETRKAEGQEAEKAKPTNQTKLNIT